MSWWTALLVISEAPSPGLCFLKTALRLKQQVRSHLGFISKQMLAPSSLPLDQTPSRMGLERREGIEVEMANLPALPPLALLHCCLAGELVWTWHL